MIAAVSSADVTVGLYVFVGVCLTLAVVVGYWPTIQGWLALLSGGNVAVSWKDLAGWPTPEPVREPVEACPDMDGLLPFDWAELRELGRPVEPANRERRRLSTHDCQGEKAA